MMIPLNLCKNEDGRTFNVELEGFVVLMGFTSPLKAAYKIHTFADVKVSTVDTFKVIKEFLSSQDSEWVREVEAWA